jgi:uncharacterized membrane protein YozB (DUF420 family)
MPVFWVQQQEIVVHKNSVLAVDLTICFFFLFFLVLDARTL